MSFDAVYLDNAATTKVDPRAAQAALEAMTETYGNPSSAHRLGVEAARKIGRAREQVAAAIGAAPIEILFTSGGTEANALGFGGAARAARGRHILLSGLEHASVADQARWLSERGYEVTVVPPEPSGVTTPAKMAAAVRAETAACALLWVQNEIGTIQPVHEIARAIKAIAPRCHVHIDAVQAVGKLAIDVRDAPFDSLALSAHKIHGPKGVGALFLRRNARLEPLVQGGAQERGIRAGTENVPGIAALGVAIELSEAARPEAARRMSLLRDQLWDGIRAHTPNALRHGDPAHAAPHLLSVGFPHLPGEPLLHALEGRGVMVSAGSACHARDKRPSPVLRAIGVADHVATLRFSLSRLTDASEISRAITAVAEAVNELRMIS